jgi:hypothetical protein
MYNASTGFYPFEPTGSLRFEDGDSPKLDITPTTTGNRKKWTFSCWFKRGNATNGHIWSCNSQSGNDGIAAIYIQSDYIYTYYDTSGTNPAGAVGPAKIRDHSAWYHLVWAVDAANTEHKVWLNGELISTDTSKYPPNYDYAMNRAGYVHRLGAQAWGASIYFDGYMAEIYHLDGQYKTADDFAESKNGVWVPKDAKGSLTFGTNGFYLPFNSTVTSEGQSTVLYEGTGGSRSVEGFGYKPDLVWWKSRNGANSHVLHDRVRGPNRMIRTNLTNAETDGDLSAFSSDGFFTTNTVDNGNYSGETYAAWAWDAGADQTPTGFGCVAYHGDGSANRPVRDVGFNPDLVWVKTRDAANDHNLFDSVRGATKRLRPSGTNAEATDVNSVVSFDDDGFTVDTNSDYNGSSNDYVAWCWDAGDGDAVSNTDGDITSTVKASTTHGFSITSFTGNGSADQTVGHGLSSAPEFIILKDRDSNSNNNQWQVSSSHIGDKYGYFTTAAFAAGAAMKPTSGDDTTFTTGIGASQGVINTSNESGDRYIAYLWHSVSGYSKFNTYSGTGSSGNAVTGLGFRPAFVMVKRTDSTSDWTIFDNQRDPFYDGTNNRVWANLASAESTTANYMEFTSDGFTLKAGDAAINASGGTYFYAAFAGGLDTISPVNTDGSLTTRVKASDDTGFSIVRYQGGGSVGDTIGHGLSGTPDWMVIKDLDNTRDWTVYHSGLSATNKGLALNTTAAESNKFQTNQMTATTMGLDSSNSMNGSGVNYIAYFWKATTGKSAFGSYTGNGSASGPSVTGLGFKPAMLMIKRADAADNWIMHDIMRDNYDTLDDRLYANLSNAEASGGDYGVDLDSDGFTVATADSGWNANGGTYIYMAFADGRDASFFHDESGQDNHFEPENVQNYDVVPDSPTNNFCTMNPLHYGGMTFAEGNLKISTTTNNRSVHGTFALPSSGKWIYEFKATDYTSGGGAYIGFSNNTNEGDNEFTGDHGIFYQTYNGGFNVEGTVSTATGYSVESVNFTADGDMHTIAIDVDNQKLYFAKNGNWRNDADPAAGTGGLDISSCFTSPETSFLPCVTRGGSYNEVYHFNFGQDDSFAGTVTPGGYTDENDRGSFKYPVPDGFLALCTQNLPDPAIDPASNDLPEDYFDTQLWTGTGSGQTFSNWSFQPDWLWFKHRNGSSDHALFDVIRGVNSGLSSNSNAAANTAANSTQDLVSFDSDGFTTGTPSQYGSLGSNTHTIVTWGWKAGGTAVSNTDGSITVQVSANTKAGFSILTGTTPSSYTSYSFGHGLDSAPEFVIWKETEGTSHWNSWHTGLSSSTNLIQLNTTTGQQSGSYYGTINDSIVTQTGSTFTNLNSDFVAYCFHGVEGYSKFGSFVGKGSPTFVHLGFRPAWLMIKNIDTSSHHWAIYDDTRDTYNVNDLYLYANSSSVESDNDRVDFVSNGFVGRANNYDIAQSGVTFIYAAFSRNPFKYAQAR